MVVCTYIRLPYAIVHGSYMQNIKLYLYTTKLGLVSAKDFGSKLLYDHKVRLHITDSAVQILDNQSIWLPKIVDSKRFVQPKSLAV